MVPRYLPRDHSEIHWRTNLPVGRIRHRHIHQVDPKGSPQAREGAVVAQQRTDRIPEFLKPPGLQDSVQDY